jgi:hypothetical protein
MSVLLKLLPVVILAVLPGTVAAQSCSIDDSYPQALRNNVDDLYDNLDQTKARSATALSRFVAILGTPEIAPEVSFGEFFERLLVENITKRFKDLPGLEIAKDTLVEVLKIQDESGAVDKSRKQRGAHEWVALERMNLANTYAFNIKTKLNCAYYAAYLALPAAQQASFVSSVGQYAREIGDSMKHENQIVIELIEQWLNDSFDGSLKTGGVLVARVEFNDVTSGIAIRSLEVASPAYSQQMGNRLNALLKDRKMSPFDLKVFKLILFHDLEHFHQTTWDDLASTNTRLKQTVCTGYEQCIMSVFVNRNNKVVFPALTAPVASELRSLSMQKFSAFKEFTN